MEIQELLQKFKTLFSKKGPVFAVIVGIFLLFSLTAFVIAFIQNSPPEKIEYAQRENTVKIEGEIQIPDSLDIEKEYYPSRITESRWTKEEAEKWLTVPDEAGIETLEKANDRLINEITGAAP